MLNTLCSDLVFVQDCTGSQGSYITSATRNVEEICAQIFHSGKLQEPEDLRVGLVAYRDHPPQDHTWVYRNFGFTSDISQVRQNLSDLYATGGGDGPEAVTAALQQALQMDWRLHASKMVVLIADAPPHGIGEYGDGEKEETLLTITIINTTFGLQGLMMARLMDMIHFKLLGRWPLEALLL